MNNKYFKHFRNPFVLKMYCADEWDTPFFFSADIQQTGNIHISLNAQNDVSMGKSGQPPQNPQKP